MGILNRLCLSETGVERPSFVRWRLPGKLLSRDNSTAADLDLRRTGQKTDNAPSRSRYDAQELPGTFATVIR